MDSLLREKRATSGEEMPFKQSYLGVASMEDSRKASGEESQSFRHTVIQTYSDFTTMSLPAEYADSEESFEIDPNEV